MPRKRGRGRRPAKKGGFGSKRELVFKDEGEEYAQVLKLLGSGRADVTCMDGKRRIAKVRGKFKRRVWIHVGDIVLVVIREFEDDKCDIVHLYYSEEARTLKQMGEIPQDIEITENQRAENELDISFGEASDDEDKLAKKGEKQNLDAFMPESDEDSESGDEAPKAKEAPKPKAAAPQPVSVLANLKAKEPEKKAPGKVAWKDEKKKKDSSDEEDGEESESGDEKRKDELDDV